MRVCLSLAALAVVSAGAASARTPAQPVRKATSVVRADPRTGRLVRTVVVRPQNISAKKTHDPAVQPLAAPNTAPVTANASLADPGLKAVIEQTAKRYDVDPLLVHSVIQVESNYDPYALSPKGAQGVMQLMPMTARRFGVTNGFDVRQNIEGGVRYLKYLNTLFPNDLRLTLAAYNAGEGAVWKYGNSVPPYRETQDYVSKVGSRYTRALQSAGTKTAAVQTPGEENAVSPQETYSRLEHYMDAQGRLCLRTVTETP